MTIGFFKVRLTAEAQRSQRLTFFSFPHLFSALFLPAGRQVLLCGADLIWATTVLGTLAGSRPLDRVPGCVYLFIRKRL